MIVCDDVTEGFETWKIPALNDLDDDKPDCFEYTCSHVPSPGCSMEDFNVQYAGCHCCGAENECCSDSSCSCIHKKSSGVNYSSEGRLCNDVADLVFGKPVYECNVQCKCSVPRCRNRMVQRGIQRKLYIVKTSTKGWSLKTTEPLARGTFVCEYAGEILSYEEAKDRSLSQRSTDKNYLIVLNEHLGSGEVICTYVDPMHVGNVGRFSNHSCSPNLTMVPVRVDSAVPRLALFANRDIVSDEELCFDYSGGGIKPSATQSRDKLCLCGSANCLRFLPFDENLFVK